MQFIGGINNPLVAIRTAKDLLVKFGRDTIKLVVHLHKNKLELEMEREL